MPLHRPWVCQSRDCGLRFPVPVTTDLGARCPRCRAPTRSEEPPWEALDVPRDTEAPHYRLAALLDNVRSVRNVGSIFRTADGAGVEHLYLAGITPTPHHPQMAKTALGAEHSVPWSAVPDGVSAARRVLDEGHALWALEGGVDAVSLFSDLHCPEGPMTLVLGHEVAGVDPRILELCSQRLYLPMEGIKGSLNVSVAFGIAVYTLRHRRKG